MTEKQYSLSEAAELLGVTTKTLRNWDKRKILSTTRTAGGHRRITDSEIRRLLGDDSMENDKDKEIADALGDIYNTQLLGYGFAEYDPLSSIHSTQCIGSAEEDKNPLPRPTVAKVADSKNPDEVIDFTRKLIHGIEDELNERLTDEEYRTFEKLIFDVHARGLPSCAAPLTRPGYLKEALFLPSRGPSFLKRPGYLEEAPLSGASC